MISLPADLSRSWLLKLWFLGQQNQYQRVHYRCRQAPPQIYRIKFYISRKFSEDLCAHRSMKSSDLEIGNWLLQDGMGAASVLLQDGMGAASVLFTALSSAPRATPDPRRTLNKCLLNKSRGEDHICDENSVFLSAL